LSFSEEKKTASLNAWIFPLVGWIWGSIPLLLIGAAIAAWPSRRKDAADVAASSNVGAAPPGDLTRGNAA
jgi:cytochrome c-type biogenesis protein CcmF